MLNLWLRLNKLIRLIRWDKSEVMSIQILWNKYVSILWAMICIWYLWYKVQIFPFFETMIYMIFMEQIFPWNNDMYMISMEQICPYLKQWYVYGIYGTNMFVLGTIIWGCLYLKQVYSYRNRTSLVCTVSGSDKTSLHQCLLMM